jgi:hypothetical protein
MDRMIRLLSRFQTLRFVPRLAFLVALAIALTSTGNPGAGALTKKQQKIFHQRSGFLGNNYGRLRVDPRNPDWLVYFKDRHVLRSSHTFLMEPVKVYLIPEARQRDISQADLDKLADHFNQAMRGQLQAGHYTLVDHPGPGVKTLRLAITNVEPNGGKTNAVAAGGEAIAAHAVVPVPGPSELIPRIKVGKVSIEGELLDSQSGEVEMAFMTSKSGRRFFSGLRAFRKWGDIDAAFRSWAKNFRQRLDRAQGT